jgi:hypothetical protein
MQVCSSNHFHTTLIMASKKLFDIEVQVQESDVSTKELCGHTDAFTEDWDAPDNKENPRNWSSCK